MKKIIQSATISLAGLMLPLIAMANRGACELNGREVPCENFWRFAKPFIGLGIGLIIFFVLIGILLTILWIWMIIHAATKNIENKALWIILLILFGHLAAIIYYFAVKRPFDRKSPVQPASPSNPGPTPAGPKIA
mgnify:CR=1 FL=1